MSDLLTFTDKGIYCPQGDFFIDPWKPVNQAVITHAHSDHARAGHRKYLAHSHSKSILKLRLGKEINLQTIGYDRSVNMNGVRISLHSAGHIRGSAQVRVESRGEVWVVSGDFKTEQDSFSGSFDPVKCNTFITESTFGLPVFSWTQQEKVMQEINQWWQENKSAGKVSILFAYALGKAQRLITSLDLSIGPVCGHGAVINVNKALSADGAVLPDVRHVSTEQRKSDYKGALIIAPGSASATSWMNRFRPYETATVSGWMNVRGIKRRRNAGKGFVLSDHADWEGLNQAVKETEAEKVYVTHGYTDVFARWLRQQGLDAQVLNTEFESDADSFAV